MKCPKCHYLSFDPEPRCRNCGYSFAFAETDLPLSQPSSTAPLEDFALRDAPEIDRSSPVGRNAPAASVPLRVTGERASARDAAGAVASPSSRDVLLAKPGVDAGPGRSKTVAGATAASAMASATGTALAEPPRPNRPAPRAAAPAAPQPSAIAPSAPAPSAGAEFASSATTDLPLFVKGLSAVSGQSVLTSAFGTAPAKANVADALPQAAASDVASSPAFWQAHRESQRADAAADAPLLSLPAEPRAPVAVQRKTTEARPRAKPTSGRKLGPLDHDLLEDLQRIERTERRTAVAPARAAAAEARPADRVGAGKRLVAAALDALVLGSLAIGVLGVTLRWCDLPLASAGVLPIAPTAAFITLVGVGYLLMFTAAGGQTLGKMALGLRIVADEPGGPRPMTMGQAAYRAVLTVPSVLTFGAGFLPALLGQERALHDRLAHTRVVRA